MKTFRFLAAACLAATSTAWAQAPGPAVPVTPAAVAAPPVPLVPVPAQLAQSPASAHGFFLAVAGSQIVTVADGRANPLQPTPITAVESAGCASRVGSQPPGPASTTVNWKDVRAVRAENERQLRLVGPNVNWVLGFETREMADRVGRALNTIRRSCDPVEGFGF
jgi:hypothetical protein